MARNLFGLIAVLTMSAVAPAEPLPWSYYVRFNSPDGTNGIRLGTESQSTFDPATGSDTVTPYQILFPTDPGNYGRVRINYQTEPETVTLFSFSYGDWVTARSIPDGKNYSDGVFALRWGFQGTHNGISANTVTGAAYGSISASGIFTSGSGNFWVGLDHEEVISLDGQQAYVRFQAVNGEESSRIDMTVTPIPSVATPEPATLLLAGIGLAGVAGVATQRRRIG